MSEDPLWSTKGLNPKRAEAVDPRKAKCFDVAIYLMLKIKKDPFIQTECSDLSFSCINIVYRHTHLLEL